MLSSIKILRPQALKNEFDNLESSLRLKNISLVDFLGSGRRTVSIFLFQMDWGDV